MKRKRKRKHDELDEELAALVLCCIDDDGSKRPTAVYTLPADIAPEAHVPGINPVAEQADLFPETKQSAPRPRR